MTTVLEPPTAKVTPKHLTLPLVALQKAMATIAPAIERRTTIPVLSNVRIAQTDEYAEFTGTNLNLSIRVRVATRAAQGKTMLLPALKLEAFSKLLQGEHVSFKLVGDNEQRAEMRCGRSVTKVPNSPPSSFPDLKFGSGEMGVQLVQSEAERLLQFTVFAIGEDSRGHAPDGALMEIVGGKLCFVATDGHRLARYTVPSDESYAPLLMPAEFLRALQKTIDAGNPALLAIDSSDEAVLANFGDKTGEIALTHRKLTRAFPNYRAVMPQKIVATITVDADSMNASLRRCLAFADERSNAVRITVDSTELKLNGASTETGETDETVDVLSASVGGDFAPFKIGFSGKYLVDGFSRLKGEVQMRFSAANGENAMMLFAEPSEGETFEYVVMPMRV